MSRSLIPAPVARASVPGSRRGIARAVPTTAGVSFGSTMEPGECGASPQLTRSRDERRSKPECPPVVML